MDNGQTNQISDLTPYNELLALLHPKGLHCPEEHHLSDITKNIYKRDHKGMPRYKCSYPGCSKSFNLFTGTPLQGTSFSPVEVILCVDGIIERMDTKALSDKIGIPERRLKKYYGYLEKLSLRKVRYQYPIVENWEAIFDKILLTGEAHLPPKDYHNLRKLVFKIWETAGRTSHWKNHLQNIVDWEIIDDSGEDKLILTTRDKQQFILRKVSFKEIDPETGKIKSTVQSTQVSLHIRK